MVLVQEGWERGGVGIGGEGWSSEGNLQIDVRLEGFPVLLFVFVAMYVRT